VLAIALAGSLVSLQSTSLLTLIVGRGIQGLSAAAIPLCFGLVRELGRPGRVPFAVGIVATVAPVVGGIGAVLGGLLVDHASWRFIFAVSAVLTLIAIGLVWRWIPGGAARAQRRIDLLGAVLLPPAVAAVLLAIHHARHWGWIDARTLALLAAGLGLLAVWWWHEWRQSEPLINVRLLGRRQIGLANLGMALFGLGALQNNQLLSLLLQQPGWTGVGLGVSATTTGLLFVPFIFINLIGGPASGRIAARHGGRRSALIGMSLTAVGWTALTLHHAQLWFVMSMAYVQTLGIAMLFAALPNLVVEDAPPDRTSEATGVLSVVRQLAASIGTQIVGYTLASTTVADRGGGVARFPTDSAFTLTLGFVACVCVLSVVVSLMLPKHATTPVGSLGPAPEEGAGR
jgi:MFS family permease